MELRKKCAAALLALSAITGAVTSASAQTTYDSDASGSLLVFPKFDVRGESETELRIVNNGRAVVDVKLVLVCPGIPGVNAFCAAQDSQLSFTPNQTRVIDVADLNPPCNQGYVVAYAVSPLVTPPGIPVGVSSPIAWNTLTGSYHIEKGRRTESENAIAFQSPRTKGTVLGEGGRLRFGTDYSALTTTLWSDFHSIESEEPEGTRLILLTLDVLAGMQNPTAVAAVNFWNAAEVPHSSSLEFVCWTELALDEIDANFLKENLGSDVGSISLQALPNCPIPGGCPPLAAYNPALLGALEEFDAGTLSIRNMSHDTDPKTTEFQPR